MSLRLQHTTDAGRCLWLGLMLSVLPLQAAEIRGTVYIHQAGLFGGPQASLDKLPISVALYPAEGQSLPRTPPSVHRVTLAGNRIAPLYLAVQRGAHLAFEDPEHLYHELFSLSEQRSQPLELRLKRDTPEGHATLPMHALAEWHWFCRIHTRSYARVDVLDTPLITMLQPGESFEFRDLPRGNWRIRVAAPGAETRFIEAEALTAPPPVEIQLSVKGFARTAGFSQPQVVTVEQLFPNQPGM